MRSYKDIRALIDRVTAAVLAGEGLQLAPDEVLAVQILWQHALDSLRPVIAREYDFDYNKPLNAGAVVLWQEPDRVCIVQKTPGEPRLFPSSKEALVTARRLARQLNKTTRPVYYVALLARVNTDEIP